MGLGKKKTANRLKRTLWLSLAAHSLILGFLLYDFQNHIGPFGAGKPGLIAVSLVSDGSREESEKSSPSFREAPQNGEPLFEEAAPAPSGGGGGGGGTSMILGEIQNKIERAKFYPVLAKRQNIEGSPVVEFKIGGNGAVEYVRLKQTSGSPLLDEAAQKTVQQAAPFPAYTQPISLSIRYALSDKPY